MQVLTEIHIPALMDGDKVVVPWSTDARSASSGYWLSREIEYRTDRKNNPLSAAEYNSQMQLPTLAELRHAFTTNNDYKQSALSKRGYGEWTSTFLQDGKRTVERPENVVYRNGVWVLEGGKVSPVELPPDGWTLEYDKPTGFPSRTSEKRKDAEKVFGDDTSYFYTTRNGVRAVLRLFVLSDGGPFSVGADCGPGARLSALGGRACRRSEQAAKQLATPVEGAN